MAGSNMKFIHATDEISAQSIIASNRIIPKKIDLYQFLDAFLERIFNIIKTGEVVDLQKESKLAFFPRLKYPYLGEGIYCFCREDEEYAKDYDANKDFFIEITTKNSATLLDLNKKKEYEKMLNDVEAHFDFWIRSEENEDERESIEVLKELLLYNLESLNVSSSNSVPFSLGIAIDKLNYGRKNDIIAFKYPKREANYIAIKQTCAITKLERMVI